MEPPGGYDDTNGDDQHHQERSWSRFDRDGTYQGRVEEKPYGYAIYDRQGRRQGYAEEKSYGDVEIYGRDGRRAGTMERR